MSEQNLNEYDDNEKNIVLLIDTKIANAKLKANEILFGAIAIVITILLSVFGIILPITQTNRANDKIDENIKIMQNDLKEFKKEIREENDNKLVSMSNNLSSALNSFDSKFKELAGNQLRKPHIVGYYLDRKLDGMIVPLGYDENQTTIQFINEGDAPARNVNYQIYSDLPMGVNDFGTQRFFERQNSEDPAYRYKYATRYLYTLLDSKDCTPLNFTASIQPGDSIKYGINKCMIKIFYEQPEVTRIKFEFNLKKQE